MAGEIQKSSWDSVFDPYSMDDAYNADETGLFFKLLPVLASALLRFSYRDVYVSTRAPHCASVLPVIILSLSVPFRVSNKGRT